METISQTRCIHGLLKDQCSTCKQERKQPITKSWPCLKCGRLNRSHDQICRECKKAEKTKPKHSKKAAPVSKQTLPEHTAPTEPILQPIVTWRDLIPNHVLALDLEQYPDILDALTRVARRDVRSLEEQCLWYVIQGLRNEVDLYKYLKTKEIKYESSNRNSTRTHGKMAPGDSDISEAVLE